MDWKKIIGNILFLDIETIPISENFENLCEKGKKLWKKKAQYLKPMQISDNKPQTESEEYQWDKAGIYAEFGKIICISVGVYKDGKLRIKSYFGDDEQALLSEFAAMINEYYSAPNSFLCAHNGKEFDFPYIARRMIINNIEIPKILDNSGKKPWEVQHFDTMELWKFGDYKSYTSLDLLAHILDIPTPKDDIDGSQVAEVYYKEKDINRIVKYCSKDVATVARVFCRLKNLPAIADKDILFVE